MNVLLAENAGFCFGVKRAVEEAIKTQKNFNKKIYTLGPLIHNGDVVKYLEENNGEKEFKKLHFLKLGNAVEQLDKLDNPKRLYVRQMFEIEDKEINRNEYDSEIEI